MSVETRALAIPASGSLLIPDPGNFFFLLTASASLNFLFQGGSGGGQENFQGFVAGLRLQRLKQWRNCFVTGLAGTTFTIFYGTETPREDETDFVQTIATIAGTVLVTPGSGSANEPVDHADVLVGTGAIDTTIAANPARKSVIIGSLSSNAPASKNLRVQAHPGAAVAKGIELQPGTFIVLQCAAAIDVYNPDANGQTYWWQEEM